MKVIMVEGEMKTRQDTTGTRTFKIKHHVFREPNDTHEASCRHNVHGPSGLQLLPLSPVYRPLPTSAPFHLSPGLTLPVCVCNRSASAESQSDEEEGDMTGKAASCPDSGAMC